jgi:hypothetical protein
LKTKLLVFSVISFAGLLACIKDKPVPNPDDLAITYTVEDSGRIVFKNPRKAVGNFNWSVHNENYYSQEASPYFVFLSNGLKKINLSYNNLTGRTIEENFEISAENAVEPKEKSQINARIYNEIWNENWLPFGNGIFSKYGSSFWETLGYPTTVFRTTDLNVNSLYKSKLLLLVDLNEKPNTYYSSFKSKLQIGPQPLVEYNEKGELVKKGWKVYIGQFGKVFDSSIQKNCLLEILEIKDGSEMKFFPDMYNTHTFWVTWHFSNGLEGNDKIEFTLKNQYFLE